MTWVILDHGEFTGLENLYVRPPLSKYGHVGREGPRKETRIRIVVDRSPGIETEDYWTRPVWHGWPVGT